MWQIDWLTFALLIFFLELTNFSRFDIYLWRETQMWEMSSTMTLHSYKNSPLIGNISCRISKHHKSLNFNSIDIYFGCCSLSEATLSPKTRQPLTEAGAVFLWIDIYRHLKVLGVFSQFTPWISDYDGHALVEVFWGFKVFTPFVLIITLRPFWGQKRPFEAKKKHIH